jgi:hypothetical protein
MDGATLAMVLPSNTNKKEGKKVDLGVRSGST